MVKWANDGRLQANDGKMLVDDGKMLVNDGEMLVNDGEMSVWYTHFTIIDEHSPSLAWCKPSFTHLTIIEKLHRLLLEEARTCKEDYRFVCIETFFKDAVWIFCDNIPFRFVYRTADISVFFEFRYRR